MRYCYFRTELVTGTLRSIQGCRWGTICLGIDLPKKPLAPKWSTIFVTSSNHCLSLIRYGLNTLSVSAFRSFSCFRNAARRCWSCGSVAVSVTVKKATAIGALGEDDMLSKTFLRCWHIVFRYHQNNYCSTSRRCISSFKEISEFTRRHNKQD